MRIQKRLRDLCPLLLFYVIYRSSKASDFTGQVAIVSHQAIAVARRYAGVGNTGAFVGYHKKKTFSFLPKKKFVKNIVNLLQH